MDMTSCHPSRTEWHTMKIVNLKTGLVSERQPPDAREMVAGGGWEFVDASTPTIGETLAAMDEVELRSLAAGTDGKVRHYNEPKARIASALTPLVESGEVVLP